jgi:hypothetical protein
MTMTPKSLQHARKIIRECEESEREIAKMKVAVVKDELVELLHQLSLLPPPDDRASFYEKLEDFLIEELFLP